MPPRTTSQPTPSPAVALQERVKNVFSHLPRALAGDAKAIHQMRVAARRLRVALPLLARKPEGGRVKRAADALRDLVRVAGGSRDLDVGAELLARHFQDARVTGPEATALKRHLRQARARARGHMVEGLLDLEIARLRRDLRALQARGPEDIFTVSRRLAQLRDEKGSDVTAALATLRDHFEPVGLHRLRIRARQLRYAAELAQALRGQARPASALWKGLQERLGAIHDRYLLAEWLGLQALGAARRRQVPLATLARRTRATLLEASRAHHRSFLQEDPAKLVQEGLALMGQKEPALDVGEEASPEAKAAPQTLKKG